MLLRVLGGLLFAGGAAGVAYSIWAVFRRPRPVDVAFGVAAPLAVCLALFGLLLVFVPGFF